MYEVPTTPTVTDRNAEIIRLNEIIVECTKKLDSINEETRHAILANQSAREDNGVLQDVVTRLNAERDQLKSEIGDLNVIKISLENDTKSLSEKYTQEKSEVDSEIVNKQRKLASLSAEINALKSDNHPIFIDAEKRLVEVREAIQKEQNTFDAVAVQCSEFQREMDARLRAVGDAERRIKYPDQTFGL